jgi:hypothetical protein
MDPTDLQAIVKRLLDQPIDKLAWLIVGIIVGGLLCRWWSRHLRTRIKELEEENERLRARIREREDEMGGLSLKIKELDVKVAQLTELEEEIRLLKKKLAKRDGYVILLQDRVAEVAEKLKQCEERLGSQQAAHEAEEIEESLEEITNEIEEDEADVDEKADTSSGRQYWVIAPWINSEPERFARVWQDNLANRFISIGWHELGDVSSLNRQQLRDLIERTYPNDRPGSHTACLGMMWSFYHAIQVGDIIVAKRGVMEIVAVGTVRRAAYYDPTKSPYAIWTGFTQPFPNHIDVEWNLPEMNRRFSRPVLPRRTVSRLDEERFRWLMSGEANDSPEPPPPEEPGSVVRDDLDGGIISAPPGGHTSVEPTGRRGVGNPDHGLLRAIMDVFRRHGPGAQLGSRDIAQELLAQGYWGATVPETPWNTVNSYLTQNPNYFRRVSPGVYEMNSSCY